MAKASQPQQAKQTPTPTQSVPLGKYIKLGIVIFILLLYGQSLKYDYVLDDGLFITNNPMVQEGVSAIPSTFTQGSMQHFKGSNFQIYRPALISFFCIEKQLFDDNAAGYHFINLLLYLFIAFILFDLLKRLFPQLHILFAISITALFIAHPIHTEVVSNIKSQDELLATLFSLLALSITIKAIDNNKFNAINITKAVLCFTVALFSKESSVAFVIIFPLAFLVLKNQTLKQTILKTLPFAIVTILFVFIRSMVLSDVFQANETTVVENVLYGAKGLGEHTATRLSILFQYIKMMILPLSMSWDYSFNQIPIINWNSWIPYTSIAIYLLIAGLIIFNIKRNKGIAFGFAFFIFLIAPTANVFFLNGTTFAERFLFLPSIGFLIGLCLFIAAMAKYDFNIMANNNNKTLYSIIGVVLVIFSLLTINRVKDWGSNFDLFSSGAKNAPNSSRTNSGIATEYMNMAQNERNPQERTKLVDQSLLYFKKSLSIFPGNVNSAYQLGLIYGMNAQQDSSFKYYRLCLQADPNYQFALTNIATAFANVKAYDSALHYLNRSYKVDSSSAMTLTNLVVVNHLNGLDDQVIQFANRAIFINQANAKIYDLVAKSWFRKGNMEQATKYADLAKQVK